ncbi:MAG TPA: hypothetical protein VFZ25_12935, partial [Chloroflexota bacterium]|nr:hypothetical protein [Chloroflexota bacterium]
MKVVLEGRPRGLDASALIGQGGEAEVYDLGDGRVAKVFKGPDHLDFVDDPEGRENARRRLAEHQQKLCAFPLALPERVVQPSGLLLDVSGQTILGYVMRKVGGADPLIVFSHVNRTGDEARANDVVATFADLHRTVTAVHQAGVVIGDFNDLNVLAVGTRAYLIDADSLQFGPFVCHLFTDRFADPLLCSYPAPLAPSSSRQLVNPSTRQLASPHTADSDWYAFAVMLFRSLLHVDPYGGVVAAARQSRCPDYRRPFHRLTVFHPEVRYPRNARPLVALPDELRGYFAEVFTKDRRGAFPPGLLSGLRWTTCPACGLVHACPTCPVCRTLRPVVAPPAVITNRGKIAVREILTTTGQVLAVAEHRGRLQWLVYEGGAYRREDGGVVIAGKERPRLAVRLRDDVTILASDGQALTFTRDRLTDRRIVDQPCATVGIAPEPAIDLNAVGRYWIENGQLWRDDTFGPAAIGGVLAGHTRFWVGPAFGLGFYRAGALSVAFRFDALRRGIDDAIASGGPGSPSLAIPRGQLLDAAGVFDGDRCWFGTTVQVAGRAEARWALIPRNGGVEA